MHESITVFLDKSIIFTNMTFLYYFIDWKNYIMHKKFLQFWKKKKKKKKIC